MPFSLSPHHVQLIAACYPPTAALVTAGPEYKPNSQELSKLTYYASNRPGKITKLGSELEKRALSDARKASSGNVRARASLLISLNIFKALIQECRRDLSMLSTSLMSILDSTLQLFPYDLEIAAKTASVVSYKFSSWTTYTTGQLLGIDQDLTRDYVSTLRRFASMCLSEVKDVEDRNRMRIIGLSALTAAVASEALYNSSSRFKPQVSAIVPALLVNLLDVDLLDLDREAENNKNSPLTTFLADFRSRPLLERRAASIHAHIDGEEGPTNKDVANASLKAFACLLSQSVGGQVTHVLQAVLDALGLYEGWRHTERCCWFVRKAIEWTQYQYRFAVPARLIERLMDAQEDVQPSDLHRTLAAMIKAAFTATVPLVNVSTSDVCSNLTALILRRVAINPNDDLLPDLVVCIGALGTHIYYADQIHDLACEIIGRLTHIESNGVHGRDETSSTPDERRASALRCLIACIELLIQTSTETSHRRVSSIGSSASGNHRKPGGVPAGPEGKPADDSSPRTSGDATAPRPTVPQRSKIPPDVWQDTLSLLCDDNFAVRSDYSRLLVLYLKSEIPPEMGRNTAAEGDHLTAGKVFSHGTILRPHGGKAGRMSGSGTSRFLHALMATLYALATSPQLRIPLSSPPTPDHSSDDGNDLSQNLRNGSVNVNITPSTPVQSQTFSADRDEQVGEGSSIGWHTSRRKSLGLTMQSRKLHRIRRLLGAPVNYASRSSHEGVEGSSACLSDYAHILHILNTVHEQTPSRALVTSLPMLLALRAWCESDSSSRHRRAAVRQILIGQWQTLSRLWDIADLNDLVRNNTLDSSFPYPPPLVEYPDLEQPLPLSTLPAPAEESVSWCGNEVVISVISKGARVQAAIGLEEDVLAGRLNSPWTPDNALKDSVESSLNGDSPRPDHGNPLLKISPALMHISNLSLQSLTRSNRGVGVNDLREALEGRSGMSNIALSQGRAPSIASLGATHSAASGESATSPSVWSANRPRTRLLSGESKQDVKNVLDKLGIGASKNKATLKIPPSPQQVPDRSMLVPPYKG